MYGYNIFSKIFSNLSVDTKHIILKNIFSIQDFSTYSVLIQENKIIFRFFGNGKFYQYVFVLNDVFHNQFIHVEGEFRLENRYIYIKNYIEGKNWDKDPLIIFVRILLSEDERMVYLLLMRLI